MLETPTGRKDPTLPRPRNRRRTILSRPADQFRTSLVPTVGAALLLFLLVTAVHYLTAARTRDLAQYNPAFRELLEDQALFMEATLATALASVLIVSAMWTFGAAGRARQVAMSLCSGSGLASQLMSEVLQCRYSDPSGGGVFGPESGQTGNRRLFDDVDDYSGWTETPPVNRDGAEVVGFAGWRRDVAVACVDPDTMAPCGTRDSGLKRITVTVTDRRGARTVLVAARSSNGSYDQKVSRQTTCVGQVCVRLQIGSDKSATIVSGQSIPNIVP